jgi:hypothetical protein
MRRRRLRNAAKILLTLMGSCPELFEHVVPISDEDVRTLREIADEET